MAGTRTLSNGADSHIALKMTSAASILIVIGSVNVAWVNYRGLTVPNECRSAYIGPGYAEI